MKTNTYFFIIMLYPARWETYRGCFSRRDGARTSG